MWNELKPILIINGDDIYTHNMPFDPQYGFRINGVLATKEQMEYVGILVDYEPKAEYREGYTSIMRSNHEVEPRKISNVLEQAKLDLKWNRENCLYFEYTKIEAGEEDIYKKVANLELMTADLLKDLAKKTHQLEMLLGGVK